MGTDGTTERTAVTCTCPACPYDIPLPKGRMLCFVCRMVGCDPSLDSCQCRQDGELTDAAAEILLPPSHFDPVEETELRCEAMRREHERLRREAEANAPPASFAGLRREDER